VSRDIVKQRSGGNCEARIAGVCTGRSSHVHHRLRKSQGGTDAPENLLDLCLACHGYIHSNPGWSYDEGFLLHWSSHEPV